MSNTIISEAMLPTNLPEPSNKLNPVALTELLTVLTWQTAGLRSCKLSSSAVSAIEVKCAPRTNLVKSRLGKI